MRLVAVSTVKNEADIIEAFVRHTQAWVDHHLIFDHDSTDGTRQILGALKAENLPITLFTDNAIGKLQQRRSNHLTRLAVENYTADWVIPLDADEILTGPSRPALETALAAIAPRCPGSLPLLNYYSTSQDDLTIGNPVLRLRYCQASPPRTRKIIIPASLVAQNDVVAGMGSHALYRGDAAIADQSLPAEFHLCHLALRSPQHQALRVVLAELQKLSRGKVHAGLDVHYRLGFQLLAEDPELFFATVNSPQASLKFQPIEYRGTGLNSQWTLNDWSRVARALLPYLEKLAASHGNLVDRLTSDFPDQPTVTEKIRELTDSEIPPLQKSGADERFFGFTALSGWGPPEGPVPEAFLPVFHWGYAPATCLTIHATAPRHAQLCTDVLTYTDQQKVQLTLNGVAVVEHTFSRTNQKETLTARLSLVTGENQVVFHYRHALVTDFDRRQLAMIFLSVRVTDVA